MKQTQKKQWNPPQQLMLFQEGSRDHVSHFQQPDNEKAQRITVISGRKCLELFERSNLGTSWAKMFAALLIGQTGWYSTRCALIWKLKVMKSSQYYFQLAPSTLRTDGIEFGLLPTPLAQTREEMNFEVYDARMKRLVEKGHKPFTMPLDQMALRGMLPTPTTRDWKGARSAEALKKAERNYTNSLPDAFAQLGQTSQLSPQFVLEMMGFPTDWTELPFLNGETNQSKEQVTP